MLKPVLAAIALAALLTSAPARAQTYDPRSPVCLQVFGELEGERMDCIFRSFPECQAAASGRPATCLMNPYFAQAAARPRPKVRKQPHAQ
ncbi:DUF3551 domain-containing protein [Bradyrhizobium stylosanthis]|uniref:Uncharacterized protein DUF3551 n=1 Tax=Bradyrhizobium stylosanthis TaxID=1803665 RepID=A0A560DMJ8_9BRAD|nr:DUF3551 domain-containing protein [Bradyrhizobium stylosanthis]TWA98341.1 uncharacterized protein DUF3551 [Bradyrhizobium stylosanthis]